MKYKDRADTEKSVLKRDDKSRDGSLLPTLLHLDRALAVHCFRAIDIIVSEITYILFIVKVNLYICEGL